MGITQKPKIATISYHRAINYGAILQVYALQEMIKKLGAECTILDYRNDKLEQRHREKKVSDCVKPKEFLLHLLLSKHDNTKFHKFRDFASKYLNLSESCSTLEELKTISTNYDKFISGSDQVWNGNITDLDAAYFLDFAEDSMKKNSYAASFGFKEIPQHQINEYRDMLEDYNHMSIREQQGAKIIKQLHNKEVEVVMDPTMLLSKDDWFKMAEDYISKNKYILVYGFGGSKHLLPFARNLSQKTGYEVIILANSYKKHSFARFEKAAGPEEFLGMFKNAEYVVTNSFHGTAFSINFNKEFFTEMLPEAKGVNSRLEDILDLFNLRHRQILSSDPTVSEQSIDYDKVNQILTVHRNKSLAFLEKIIRD